jgi:hypothetical protein
MEVEEIIKELEFNNRWLNHEYKQSNYYNQYLVIVNNFINNNRIN